MGSPPAFGALGAMFTTMRLLQAVSLVSIIGLTSNFVAELVSSDFSTPSALVGTLVVACLATVYILISYILYWDHMLPLLVATAADTLCFIASIIVACVLGRPVSYLNCSAFPKKGNTGNFIYSLFANVKHSSSNTFEWVDPSKTSCYEIKAIWGLSIATSILFFMSAVAAICLWKRVKGGYGCREDGFSGVPPTPNVLHKARSLGTMAMSRTQHQDGRSLYDGDEDLDMNVPVPLFNNDRHPYFPPPPAAAKKTKRRVRHPVEEMPPLPPLPAAYITQRSPVPPVPPMPPSPPSSHLNVPLASPMSATSKTKRKTLLQHISGWWDLGLMEKRQTLVGGKSG
ncbi:hypothetical protein CI102_10949 [Trichoderma harzianum]|uniref:MARVEL domain-containing protein n=1 Tax=Trichoderma harzianum CBS 226.95 TaxID=983964 RepID=A0A2T4ADZ5_TRIHA|nr:hypothetical protein M431DRAFT_551952 [Trichoderma harzianum CBS 226.95]PKK44760.1 hypothetical protein CI102_10949 [Trichoderma harzianum]PTB55314.1 hypothetical protein M431DRAFT_551952 [Trichoderma harzianum CBS 226.95]